MTFDEVVEQIKKIESEHRQTDIKGYFEMVVAWKSLGELTRILKSFFSQPYKPSDIWPTEEAQMLTAPYGGIRENQTLYYSLIGSEFYMAMLWPWADGMLITVKLIRGKPQEKMAVSFFEKMKNLFGKS